jgi:hypothetical protein
MMAVGTRIVDNTGDEIGHVVVLHALILRGGFGGATANTVVELAGADADTDVQAIPHIVLGGRGPVLEARLAVGPS